MHKNNKMVKKRKSSPIGMEITENYKLSMQKKENKAVEIKIRTDSEDVTSFSYLKVSSIIW